MSEKTEILGRTVGSELLTWLYRIVLSVIVPVVFFVVMRAGFLWLRRGNANQVLIAAVAIVWGIGGFAMLYVIANSIVEQLPDEWKSALLPFVFVGPALAILGWYLVMPVVRSFINSFRGASAEEFIGLENYIFVFSDRVMLQAFRNNVFWLVLGTGVTVALGLLIAVLADRTVGPFETAVKSLIFLPMAISFIGAGVIWKFMYAFRPAGTNQIGVLNAIKVALGGEPTGWLTVSPTNTLLMIVVLIWMQTGFAMVILSAALKGVPMELLEAGRIDGANEVQIFLRIMIPYIQGSIVTVSTSILLICLKIFDIVWAMTGGQFGTNVIGTVFWRQMFTYRHNGRASAIAMVLLVLVIPVMWYNLQQLEQEAF